MNKIFKKVIAILAVFVIIISCTSKKEEIMNLSKKGAEGIPAIAQYLKDPDPEIRKTALEALAQTGEKAAIPYIEAFVNSARKLEDRQLAIKALQKLNQNLKEEAPKPQKPTYKIYEIKKTDPLEKQINYYVHNFLVKDNPYNKPDDLELKVEGDMVINYTDMTDFYKETQRTQDWRTFFEYVRRTVLGFPTGDVTGEIFKKFPQIKKFKEVAYVGIGEPYKDEMGRLVYKKKKIIGSSIITRINYFKIDSLTKEYLDKLSVLQNEVDEFEKQSRKYVTNVWYDPEIVSKAKNQKAVGTE